MYSLLCFLSYKLPIFSIDNAQKFPLVSEPEVKVNRGCNIARCKLFLENGPISWINYIHLLPCILELSE